MEKLTEEQEEFIDDFFIGISEYNIGDILENLIEKKIWYSEEFCIKINDDNVLITSINEENESQKLLIGYDILYERLKTAQQIYCIYAPDESIKLESLIAKLKK